MIYFLSDAHLGSLAIAHARTHERRLVRFLDSIKDKAEAIYLLGDMFDFWNEYRYVVPKGYTRFLGQLTEKYSFWHTVMDWATLTISLNYCEKSFITLLVNGCLMPFIHVGEWRWD